MARWQRDLAGSIDVPGFIDGSDVEVTPRISATASSSRLNGNRPSAADVRVHSTMQRYPTTGAPQFTVDITVSTTKSDDRSDLKAAGGGFPGGFFLLRPAWALARRCGVRGACQVLYRPGRGNGELKARVPVARRDLKEAGDKPLARRTGTA